MSEPEQVPKPTETPVPEPTPDGGPDPGATLEQSASATGQPADQPVAPPLAESHSAAPPPFDPPGSAAASWGDAPRRRGQLWRWSTKTAVVAAVIGVALLVGAGGVVYAVTNSDDDSGHGRSERAHHQGERRPGASDRHITMSAPLATLHGEFVVSDGQGGYVTKATQVGVVTEIDSDSVTVKSDDGYTRTYAIDADTARRSFRNSGEESDIAKDDTVVVAATVSGDRATADTIVERGGENRDWRQPRPLDSSGRLPLPGHGPR